MAPSSSTNSTIVFAYGKLLNETAVLSGVS
ncbi:hypothetical protein P879_10573 [Paragonimus westermani]|uniref:Uncharacterized protein n=1 Tax=Paragonimus westermani TaxID=34504 RepID=A0A8T0DHP5_9TREM|nr:hypothetical protein P879_10573 [Paragonimus westermani]